MLVVCVAALTLSFQGCDKLRSLLHPTAKVHSRPTEHTASRRQPRPRAPETARLAIILDDLGNDREAADAIFALPYHLTISVLPYHAHSSEIAQEAHRRGYQVMLHLPMEAQRGEKSETQELRPGRLRFRKSWVRC
jgi:polysaccharide deacetylase 2 family uncharacterized protein YibQ